MNALQFFKTKKAEIVEQTLALIPEAISGDQANRTFFVTANPDGAVTVDYYYYKGTMPLEDNCFFTIKEHETPDPADYGGDSFEDTDVVSIYADRIAGAIDKHIMDIENMKNLHFNQEFSARAEFEDLEAKGWDFTDVYESGQWVDGIETYGFAEAEALVKERSHVLLSSNDDGDIFYTVCHNIHGTYGADRQLSGDEPKSRRDIQELYDEGKLWEVWNDDEV